MFQRPVVRSDEAGTIFFPIVRSPCNSDPDSHFIEWTGEAERAIMVTILPIESATEDSGGSGGGHAAADRVTAKNIATTPPGRTGDIAPTLAPAALERLPTEIPSAVADTIETSITGVSVVGASNNTSGSYGSDNGPGGDNRAGGTIGQWLGQRFRQRRRFRNGTSWSAFHSSPLSRNPAASLPG